MGPLDEKTADRLARRLGNMSPFPTVEGKAVFLTGVDTGLMIALSQPRLAERMRACLFGARAGANPSTRITPAEEADFIATMADMFGVSVEKPA